MIEKEIATMSQPCIEEVPIDSIETPAQVRENIDPETIFGLAQTVKEIGIRVPIILRRMGARLVLTDGARRLAGARSAGLTSIPAIIENRELSDAEVIQYQFILNCQRDDLAPMEKAKAIDRLMKETGWSATQTASKLGLSNAAVTRSLSLLTLPDTIRKDVESGEILPSAAYQLAQVENAEKQAELAKEVVTKKLTRDKLANKVQEVRHATETNVEQKAPSRVTAKLNGGVSVTVKAPELTLTVFLEVLESLSARARHARKRNIPLNQFLKSLTDHTFTWEVKS
ncbi:MAG TPA: ParB/RepB/Spo0J family partition protein [Tepidisphaeraceae bacterium]